jgi:hypothetical protein
MPFGPKGLVVTWSGPAPRDARVSYTSGSIFDAVNRIMGPEIPHDFPKQYSADLKRVDLFNAQMSWASNDFVQWQKRHNVEMQSEPVRIFEDYIKKDFVIASTLVEHPQVAHPEGFEDACSVVLQRAVIVINPDPGMETLLLRSYFHSTDKSGTSVNFAPRGGLQIEFASKTIWFPLELTSVIAEPAAYVVLDILSLKTLDAKQLPEGFRVEKTGEMKYLGKSYRVTRITAKLAANRAWADLNIQPTE